MKYLCELPDENHYIPLPCDRPDRWRWQDKDSDLVIIDSRIPDPWNREVCLLVGWKKTSGHNSKIRSVSGAKLLIFDPAVNLDAMPVQLNRTIYPSQFAYTEYEPKIVEFLSIALFRANNAAPRQLAYEFLLSSQGSVSNTNIV